MTTTISPCGDPPSVLNGQVYKQTSGSTEYECLSGFAMSGNKVITCTTGATTSWDSNIPICSIIDQTTKIYVNDSWWVYLVAASLGALFILAFVWLVWCMCCAAGRKAVVFPVGQSSRNSYCGSCCRKSRDRDGLVAESPPGYYHSSRGPVRQYYHPSTGLLDLEDGVFFVPVRPVDQNRQDNSHVTKPAASPIKEGTPRKHDVTWQRVVQQVQEENTKQRKAKELDAWMPHSHSLRNINTSTK
ncbi:uncharacterized protein LOC121367032 isoform X1 [Gigantopelta aegis]|uniref:uncharacterized protein LOC121367032 isoform X1 n=1 Tax=Gigantopelta aegis TaxID=1735272 RepID=UPI001B88DFB8|nr:uncharacterized protein LOC121367032 isoform X1 [Gigantopelta aegis]